MSEEHLKSRGRQISHRRQLVIEAQSIHRLNRGYYMMVKRAPFERVLELLEVGGLEMAEWKTGKQIEREVRPLAVSPA